MESTDIVAFEKVSKTYDGKSWVVDNLSLTIKTGEFLTLLGPSGSGKTTTLMMLAGFETPEAGRILVDGKDIVPLAPYKRDMGVMFQSYALFPHMTIAQNIAFRWWRAKYRPARSRSVLPKRWISSSFPMSRIANRRSFPAGSSSASHSPAPWSIARAWS